MQVGLVALNLIGEPIGSGPALPPGGYLQVGYPVRGEGGGEMVKMIVNTICQLHGGQRFPISR